VRLRRGAIVLVGLGACRFGGPSADPYAYVSFPEEGGALEASTAADDGGFVAPIDATIGRPGKDGNDSAPSSDEASGDDGSSGNTSEGGACAAAVAVCNPVHNTGCNPLQQCDVDVSQTTTPTGLCVFNGGAPDTGPCSASIVNESCAPRFTCLGGSCRELCFCDADCPAGQCCSDTSGPHGFTLCQPCP
jgi:hypothetical protein